MDTNTVLQDAGLIDPSGAPTTPANFGATPEPDKSALNWGELGFDDESVFGQAPASIDSQKPADSTTPANVPQSEPQKFEAAPQPRVEITPQQAHQYGRQQIDAMYNQAIIEGLSLRDAEGKPLYSRAELEAQFAPIRVAMESNLQADVVKHQMAPYAQRMAAEHIAKQYGIKVEDILDGSSPEVMEDRAKTIARFTREQKFTQRADSKADTVEGSRGISTAMSHAYEQLTPQQKIKYGLMRGDR